ncbi:MAG: inverse autotransporter beta domain-containing protein, partial [bacterium]|nr:inverse autotransporter beta domain-containing protein [bacterium]
MHKINHPILFLTANILSFAHANTAQAVMGYNPHLRSAGTVMKHTYGEVDGLIPLLGNETHLTYVNPEGRYGNDHGWFTSMGLGHRYLNSKNYIMGGYLFFDYNTSAEHTHFSVLNPGIELINLQWDMHVNGYFPVGTRVRQYGTYTGSQLGYSNSPFFSGHTQYESRYRIYQKVNTGVDSEMGYTLAMPTFNNPRLFGGVYYARAASSVAIKGVQAGVEFPLFENSSVLVRNSYDNFNRNSIGITLRLSLGNASRTGERQIQQRMTDLIPRHLANVNSGDGIIHPTMIKNTGDPLIIKKNIWFFNPLPPKTSSESQPNLIKNEQQCTFEHPCQGFAQDDVVTINTLAPNANLYLSSGLYESKAVLLASGQKLEGRTLNFGQPAQGMLRPLFNNSLVLLGNTSITNMRINANRIVDSDGDLSLVGVTIYSNPNENITIKNTDIQSTSSIKDRVLAVAVLDLANGNVFIEHSKLNATLNNNAGAGSNAIAISREQASSLSINNSILKANSISNNIAYVVGINNLAGGLLNVNHSSVSASGSTTLSPVVVTGLFIKPLMTYPQ